MSFAENTFSRCYLNKSIAARQSTNTEESAANPLKAVQFTKDLNGIYLTLIVRSTTLNSDKKGVTITLKNGMKIFRPKEKINVEYDGGYVYMSFMKLTPNEIKKMMGSAIINFRLYHHNKVVEMKTRSNALHELRQLASNGM
ncbi:hypothetical protein [Mucilaginibacter terrae]|nr:hypothetical protein [Mucilaginibacter terrae]